MKNKLARFKEGIEEICSLCYEIGSHSLNDAMEAIDGDIHELRTSDEQTMEKALSLLEELRTHVNDLGDDFLEMNIHTIDEINQMIDELISDIE